MITEQVRGYFGFERIPFDRSLAVSQLFASASHNEAVARIGYAIATRGLAAITGETGAGKTVAARAATACLDASRYQLIYLPNPQVGARGIHHAVVTALGGVPRFHHATLIPQAAAALAAETAERGRLPVLLVDEAHLLSHDQLEAIRMLTLCRDRDYAGGRQECPGDRVHACQASGIIPGPRGTRGACPAAGTCPSSSSATRSGQGPFP